MANSLPSGWFESGHSAIVLYVKDFRDPFARRKKFRFKPWASIKDIKNQLQIVWNVPTNAQKIYHNGRELKNAHNLQQCGIYQDHAVLEFVARRPERIPQVPVTRADKRELGHCGNGMKAWNHESKQADRCGRLPDNSNGVPMVEAPRDGVTNGAGDSLLKTFQMPSINIQPYGAYLLPISLLKILHKVLQALALGLAPELAMDGTGGTYFFKDVFHRNVCCFKPKDEEPFGPNNPRGLVGQLGQSGLRKGILSGEACERELAAYLLDKDHFSGVPATSLVEARHPVFKYDDTTRLHFKIGSFQEFVKHDDVVSDVSPSQFSSHEVHKIVLLDMRLLNTDRNDANILVRRKRIPLSENLSPAQRLGQKSSPAPSNRVIEYELVPIDHGYCLPQYLEVAWCDWCWYQWPQLRLPLSEEDHAYVLSLDPNKEMEKLSQKIPLRPVCRRNFLIASMVVQKGVRGRVSLYEIARLMCREDLDTPSDLEKLCLHSFEQLLVARDSRRDARATDKLRLTTSVPGLMSMPPARPSLGNGLQSPPGFWASQKPTQFFGEDFYSTELEHHGQSTRHLSYSSGDSHSNCGIEDSEDPLTVKTTHATEKCTHHEKKVCDPSDVNDEFDAMNKMLDGNANDEKLFLSLLSKSLDEAYELMKSKRTNLSSY
uniref:Phosphatidylinositol kinase (PIKF) putative n=1 Tax=Albugo laibachii Nc14 TaxID=890382 RepID=F0WL98_9STRA|nr:phosphatidylinositol kinase (PIKF) putative [Albugo laibachii Nc14]|eukprot:CCA22060.1 phosphatidylinositol kinase (PIKF) putative [Albugo laibachii Nc14]